MGLRGCNLRFNRCCCVAIHLGVGYCRYYSLPDVYGGYCICILGAPSAISPSRVTGEPRVPLATLVLINGLVAINSQIVGHSETDPLQKMNFLFHGARSHAAGRFAAGERLREDELARLNAELRQLPREDDATDDGTCAAERDGPLRADPTTQFARE